MDIRIVNTCDNKCLFCLEQNYRKKNKFINRNEIFNKIFSDKLINETNITFFWWNPLLHPDILEIMSYCKSLGFESIWIITNWNWINIQNIEKYINNGLNSIWIYFNSFNENIQKIISNGEMSVKNIFELLVLLQKKKINIKVIINVNALNIKTLYNDVLNLNKKVFIEKFEFINYFPFSKAYENRKILWYHYDMNRESINKLFQILEVTWVKANFYKFDKLFFWEYEKYYDYNKWILNQIWDEDYKRLKNNKPYCLIQNRCKYCFIKDNCKFYV